MSRSADAQQLSGEGGGFLEVLGDPGRNSPDPGGSLAGPSRTGTPCRSRPQWLTPRVKAKGLLPQAPGPGGRSLRWLLLGNQPKPEMEGRETREDLAWAPNEAGEEEVAAGAREVGLRLGRDFDRTGGERALNRPGRRWKRSDRQRQHSAPSRGGPSGHPADRSDSRR